MERPKDVVAVVEADVELVCMVGGDPLPRVAWTRPGGVMPLGRTQTLNDQRLQIHRVLPKDEGEYKCEAQNIMGSVSARVFLHVQCMLFRSFCIRGEKQSDVSTLWLLFLSSAEFLGLPGRPKSGSRSVC